MIAEYPASREDMLTLVATAMRMRADRTAPTPDERVPQGYEAWLREMFPHFVTHGFAEHHRVFWDWVWALRPGVRPRPLVCIWPRGGAKSTSVEMACAAVGARGTRKYILYVSGKQTQADDHVMNVAGLLESRTIAERYPSLGERLVGKYGASRGWARNRLRTSAGLTIDALGLDVAARGAKLDEARPDLIVFDDVDDTEDSVDTVIPRKIRAITRKLLPAGSSDVASLFVQNLVHHEGVAARLAGLASEPADFLVDRILSGPLPALRNFDVERRPDGKWRIVSGTPIWDGQDRATCEYQVNDWGLRAFRAEAQHERIPPTGAAFPEFEQSVHVCAPFPIPDAWPKIRVIDYGYAVPYCCLWIAEEPSGALVAYRETYGAGLTATEQAKQVALASGDERYVANYGDPAMWASKQEGRRFKSVADQYKAQGIQLKKATNDRLAGWERVHDRLDWAEERPPGLRIFSTCHNLIRTLPMLPRDPNRPEDVDTDAEDHAGDALRYGVMAFTRTVFGQAVANATGRSRPPTIAEKRHQRSLRQGLAGARWA